MEDAFLFDYLLKEKSEDEIQPERYNDLQGCETLCAQLGLKNELFVWRTEDRNIKRWREGEAAAVEADAA